MFCFFIMAILFVVTRMVAVDMDIDLDHYNKEHEKTLAKNKELKAKKASLLSTIHLRKLARKYDLQQPKTKQIILID